MRREFGFLMIGAACVFGASILARAADLPPWAYGFNTPPGSTAAAAPARAGAPAAPDPTPRHVAGSDKVFVRQQIANQYGPADWFPEDHGPMPEIVAHGRQEAMIAACSLCHYPNGKGRPENAGVTGLPKSYFIQTMHDFRDGMRKSADPRKANTNRMISFAKNMTDDEIQAAADYFGAMKWTPWMKVVEADMVPKTRPNNGMFLMLEGNEKEPLGHRLIETPVKAEETEVLRNDHSGFLVYTPKGSLKRGEALVKTGAGRTTACGLCHGADLRGLGPVPGLAGRSPSYLGRQLYDMQAGFRKGEWTSLMKPVVANLSDDDLIAITAYIASMEP